MRPVNENRRRPFRFPERNRLMRARQFPSMVLLCLFVFTFASGCYVKTGLKTESWQDTSPPELSLKERARAYQEKLETRHQMPDGLIRYRQWEEEPPEPPHPRVGEGVCRRGTRRLLDQGAEARRELRPVPFIGDVQELAAGRAVRQDLGQVVRPLAVGVHAALKGGRRHLAS